MALTYTANQQFVVGTEHGQRVVQKGEAFGEGDPILGEGFGTDESLAHGRGREKLFVVSGEPSKKSK